MFFILKSLILKILNMWSGGTGVISLPIRRLEITPLAPFFFSLTWCMHGGLQHYLMAQCSVSPSPM